MIVAASDRRLLVTGGAGYVGAALVPALLGDGHAVTVLDLFLYGKNVLASVADHPRLKLVHADLRDEGAVREAVCNCDTVIHLACISNDPSFELNPELGKSINYDAFAPLVDAAKEAGATRFIYASSSSVYGISDADNVDEDHELKPLTDYSRYKALCEADLTDRRAPGFETVIVRPATVCGYSPRQRIDLTVNILTAHALEKGLVRVFGGDQKRPNIHIADIVSLYQKLVMLPGSRVDGQIFNAGYQNHRVRDIAQIVKTVVEQEFPESGDVQIVYEATDDLRSYHIVSNRVAEAIGFRPKHTIEDAVRDLCDAYRAGTIRNLLSEPRYHNVKLMKQVGLA